MSALLSARERHSETTYVYSLLVRSRGAETRREQISECNMTLKNNKITTGR
jgi:hypothetical protein